MSASKRDALSNRHDPLDFGISAKAIFLEALEIPSADDRDQFIQGRCGGDESLGKEVWRLLAHHGEMGSFLKSPPQEAMLDPTVATSISERPGAQIGRYKLLQQIGEGGMGTVFMAEQTKPIARRVALKIIKPGMDSKAVVARFEAERQALAMMDHPSIAKVLEAGTTESERPYFVMELVKGNPITEYCDAHKLPLRERLDLFIQVCQAVQHAHQKGVIHRDIKPSNVLVAKYDNKPVPKIIDFGVAKAISQRLTEKTMFTQFGQIVGTLEYRRRLIRCISMTSDGSRFGRRSRCLISFLQTREREFESPLPTERNRLANLGAVVGARAGERQQPCSNFGVDWGFLGRGEEQGTESAHSCCRRNWVCVAAVAMAAFAPQD